MTEPRTHQHTTPINSTSVTIELPFAAPTILACGAWLKNTVCITHNRTAYISSILGDLNTAHNCDLYTKSVFHFIENLHIKPEIVVHDLHPDFYSTHFACHYASLHDLPALSVQHHHAHIGAICAEHGITSEVVGIALDGVGLGTDNMPWGGELLFYKDTHAERLGHLQPLAMPGGDQAAREPWRMAAAALFHLGRNDEIFQRFSEQPAVKTVITMLQRKLNSPLTSSMGRLFDAAAGLLGINLIQSHEAQAAIQLENLASAHGPLPPLVGGYLISKNNLLDFSPLLNWLVDEGDSYKAPAIFHATLAAGLAEWATNAAIQHQVSYVALGGGCFHNALLHSALRDRLTANRLKVISAEKLLPDDSAISLGQAWIVANHSKKYKNYV